MSNRPSLKPSPFRTGGLGESLSEAIEPTGGMAYRLLMPAPWSSEAVPPQGWTPGASRSARPVRVVFEAPQRPEPTESVAQVAPEPRNRSR